VCVCVCACMSFFLHSIVSSIGQIPSLNSLAAEYIPPNSLARFRCMVQDVFDPEYYPGLYQEQHLATGRVTMRWGKYRDIIPIPEGSDVDTSLGSVIYERLPLFCTSVPGEAAWVAQALSVTAPPSRLLAGWNEWRRSVPKRPLEARESVQDPSSSSASLSPSSFASSSSSSLSPPSSFASSSVSSSQSAAAVMDTDSKSFAPIASPVSPLIPPPSTVNCIVKMYDSVRECFKVGDVIEVVGVLVKDYFDPDCSELDEDQPQSSEGGASSASKRVRAAQNGGMDVDVTDSHDDAKALRFNPADPEDLLNSPEFLAHNPPASRALRLHCITCRKIDSYGPSPDSAQFHQLRSSLSPASNPASPGTDARSTLVSTLSSILGGDTDAAEILLCCIMSRIFDRSRGVLLGKFSLNISLTAPQGMANAPGGAAASPPPSLQSLPFHVVSQVHQFLCSILPKILLVRLDIASLNESRMGPVKNNETNRIEPSLLLASAGTVFIIDETHMHLGTLSPKIGIPNMIALQTLVKQQKLKYDFEFYPLYFDVEHPALVFSSTNSILPVDCDIQLQDGRSYPLEAPSVPEELLQLWRVYLAIVRQLPFSIGTACNQAIEEDFIAMRKENSSVTESDLHLFLTFARLLALTHLEETLSIARWRDAMRLMRRRIRRRSSEPDIELI